MKNGLQKLDLTWKRSEIYCGSQIYRQKVMFLSRSISHDAIKKWKWSRITHHNFLTSSRPAPPRGLVHQSNHFPVKYSFLTNILSVYKSFVPILVSFADSQIFAQVRHSSVFMSFLLDERFWKLRDVLSTRGFAILRTS